MSGFRFFIQSWADMAELADAPDLGSGVLDVQVQVLLSALQRMFIMRPNILMQRGCCKIDEESMEQWLCFCLDRLYRGRRST